MNLFEKQGKDFFQSAYPVHAAKFEAAKTDQERFELFIDLKKHIQTELMEKFNLDVEGSATYALSPQQYDQLINAKGDQISQNIQTIVNTLSLIKDMNDADQISAQMWNAGTFLFASAGLTAFYNAIAIGTALEDAAAIAIASVGVAPVVALVVALVVLILVPMLYLMFKPAYTFTMLINETDRDLTFLDSYAVHGELTSKVDTISAPHTFPDKKTIYTAGFVSGSKHQPALYGCQMGFSYKYDDQNQFDFGVESPLTSIQVDNNCYCGINSSAENLAFDTDSHNVQSYSTSSNNFTAIIKCASKSGNGAWCLARAIKKS